MIVVLDSSAVLAVLLEEPGAAKVIADLSGAEMSIINACEVLTKTEEQGGDAAIAMDIIIGYGIRIPSFRDAHAIHAARLRPLTTAYGLSLGDRACLTQGKFSDRPILTGDHRMAEAAEHLGIDIRMIR